MADSTLYHMFSFSLSNRVTNSPFVFKISIGKKPSTLDLLRFEVQTTLGKDESKDFKKDESKDFKSDELEIQTMLLDLLRFEIQQ